MPTGSERFDLDATLAAIGQALQAIICHAVFDAALHGIAVALVVGACGFFLVKRQKRFGRPLMAAARKLMIFCTFLLIPGFASLLLAGHLPPVGVFQVSSLGFIVFWCVISLHLSAEEMNFQWFS